MRSVLLALMLLLLLPQPIGAVTLTADVCAGVDEYVAAVEQGFEESREAIADEANFLSPSELGDDNAAANLMALSRDQLLALADVFDDLASELRAIEPPAVAGEAHEQLTREIQTLANVFRNGATVGILVALMALTNDSATATSDSDQLMAAAAQICPALWAVVEADDLTPTPVATRAMPTLPTPIPDMLEWQTIEVEDDHITLRGFGSGTSGPFTLAAGTYVVEVRYEADNTGYADLQITAAPNSRGVISYAPLMNKFLSTGEGYTAEVSIEVIESGEFVLDTDGTGRFSVVVKT